MRLEWCRDVYRGSGGGLYTLAQTENSCGRAISYEQPICNSNKRRNNVNTVPYLLREQRSCKAGDEDLHVCCKEMACLVSAGTHAGTMIYDYGTHFTC